MALNPPGRRSEPAQRSGEARPSRGADLDRARSPDRSATSPQRHDHGRDDPAGVAEWPVWTTTARLVVTDPSVLVEATRGDRAPGPGRRGRQPVPARLRGLPDGRRLRRAGTGQPAAGRAGRCRPRPPRPPPSGAVDPTLGGPLRDLGYADRAAVPRRCLARAELRIRPADRTAPDELADVRLDGALLTVPAGTLLDLGATAKAHAADHCATSSPTGSAAACWSASAATCGPPGRRRTAAGRCWCRTARTSRPATSGWRAPRRSRRRRPCTGRGGRAAGSCTTSSTRPRAGRRAPVWRTVSVAADSCVRANTWSTAALVRGHAAERMLRASGLAARLVAADGVVLRLGGWPA